MAAIANHHPPVQTEHGQSPAPGGVSARERIALTRKLDAQLIPVIMLLYLFSFLDRGTQKKKNTPPWKPSPVTRPFSLPFFSAPESHGLGSMERNLTSMDSEYWERATIQLGGRSWSHREPVPSLRVYSLRHILRKHTPVLFPIQFLFSD